MLIPSIDILDGKAVQLEQGDPNKKIVEKDDVFELLEEYSVYGEVAIIDLNAALGLGDNRALITQMLKKQPARVGGGIRSYQVAREYLSAGATKIIIGTRCRDDFVKKLPKQRLIFAIDAFGDNWAVNGWQDKTHEKILDIIPELEKDCGEFLYTQVNKEGLLQGIDKKRVKSVIKKSGITVTIAGGISSYHDIQFINKLGANSQIGMSLYTQKISLAESVLACLDFTKSSLIPTIVQDQDSGQILMLAYSSQESLSLAMREKKGVYFSRSRKQLWEKGSTSGNYQELVNIDYDCDGDSLIFKVRQKGVACHFDRYSCFARQEKQFSLNTLDQVLSERQMIPSESSYSSQLFSDTSLQVDKLNEECQELIEAQEFADVRWEAADLMYFTLVYAKSRGVSAEQIIQELGARNAN
ncbi:phosphoribosyl-AMP cyclohydrolase [Kangiella sp. TOML190]|uniref:phosphoribosyl-AMP cyclohydrolase n=1 Tax=Kangiella sp. TOML190 TaxID=2931351 RepID=UPI002041622C|nr:phosphoribosyl-AMP cyclohydrolase [Kangiella sp. TOML190]